MERELGKQLRLASILFTIFISFAAADITNWLTGEIIPGTENITPGPGSPLSDWRFNDKNLKYADLSFLDLTGSGFRQSWLDYAIFSNSDLTNTSFRSANLTEADFTNAIIIGADFDWARGFTKEQLYSTSSYKNANLNGVAFSRLTLYGWDFSGQDLTSASFSHSNVAGAVFTDAVINKAYFWQGSYSQFSKEQLYSTASYKNRDLTGIRFGYMSLYNWDLSNQDLTGASFQYSDLRGTDFTDSLVTTVDFSGWYFVPQQLYSTASYKNRDLHGVHFGMTLVGDWNFSGQNLTDACFETSTMERMNFSGANLTRADFYNTPVLDSDFTDAIVKGANFKNTRPSAITRQQLYSTASYKMKDLSGIILDDLDIAGWDLSHQNLTKASFSYSSNYDTHFGFADLRLASGWYPEESTITRNTIRPDGRILGLNMLTDETLVIRNTDLQITVTDLISLADGSKLQFVFDANPWGSTINVDASLVPVLDGSIELLFAPGIDVHNLISCTFKLFNWNDTLASGQAFDTILTQDGLLWDTSNLYTTGEITLIPEPATIFLLGLGGLCVRRILLGP